MGDRDIRSCRVLPFWSWNDKLNRTELMRQIDCFAAAGCGGFFIHSRVGLITPYLSDEWMELVKECCAYAKGKGLLAWLYDEDLWPSGYAGGKVPAQSDLFRDRYLCLSEEGEQKPGDRAVRAFDRAGKHYAAVIRVSPAGNARFNGQSYIDTLNPDAVRAFLDCTLEAYERAFGGKMKEYVGGIFTDEPCYIMRAFSGGCAVPYSDCMDGLYRSASGRELAEDLPKLFFDDGDYRAVRFHYYKCLSERFTESYVRQYAARCAAHGIRFTGHLMGEETCVTQTAWIGSAMANYPWFDIPGVDKIFRGTDDLVQYKQLTSVSEQCGKEGALCECFAGIGQECGMIERKRIVDFQAVNGITLVNPHLALYSMRGERKRDYPPNLFFQQPYYAREKAFGDYTARISAAAGFGRRDVHILIVHPLSTVWSTFLPAPVEALTPAACDKALKELSYGLQACGIEFHYGDEQILAARARVEGSRLILGDYAYEKVILCGSEVLFASTLRLLSRVPVYALGGTVLEDGCKEVRLERAKVFPDLRAMINALRKEETAAFTGGKGDVICSSRVSGEERAYLFVNKARAVRTVRLSEALYKAAEEDLVTGKTSALNARSFGRFDPLQSKLLRLPAAGAAKLRKGKRIAGRTLRAKICDLNCLCVDRADLYLNGALTCRDEHLSKIWHSLFYPLPDGTPYALEYRFFYDGGEVEFAAVENAENLEAVFLNGVRTEPLRRRGEPQTLDEKAYIDPCLTRVPLPGLRKGWNVLRLEGRKTNNIAGIGMHRALASSAYEPTEAEFIYIVGAFCVRGGKIAKGKRTVCGNLAKRGFPYYAGRIEGETAVCFKESGDFIVEQRGGNAAVFALYLDGEDQGSRFAPPYRWEVRAEKGSHTFCLKAYGTLFNFFGPRYLRGYRKRPWITAWDAADPSLYRRREIFQPLSLGRLIVSEGGRPAETDASARAPAERES